MKKTLLAALVNIIFTGMLSFIALSLFPEHGYALTSSTGYDISLNAGKDDTSPQPDPIPPPTHPKVLKGK